MDEWKDEFMIKFQLYDKNNTWFICSIVATLI